MTITEKPKRPYDEICGTPCDWVAWLKTDDGLHVMVQIDFHATQEQADAIVARFVK